MENIKCLLLFIAAAAQSIANAQDNQELLWTIDCIGYYRVAGDIKFDSGDKAGAAMYYKAAHGYANAAKKMGDKNENTIMISYEKFKKYGKESKNAKIRETGANCEKLLNTNKIVSEEVTKSLNK